MENVCAGWPAEQGLCCRRRRAACNILKFTAGVVSRRVPEKYNFDSSYGVMRLIYNGMNDLSAAGLNGGGWTSNMRHTIRFYNLDGFTK